jgi:RNA polymerase sigma-70 factor (ECF subfamily)
VNKDPETDGELVSQVLAGDRGAFEALVRRYQGPVYNAALRITGNSEDASDVAQTVFFKVSAQLAGYDRDRKFFSWIYRITINESINVVESRHPEDPLGEDDDFGGAESSDPAWQVQQRQMAVQIQRALRAVSTQDRVVLTLRHFSECSYEEIAQILAVQEKTVKSRLFDARRRLGEQLRTFKAV